MIERLFTRGTEIQDELARRRELGQLPDRPVGFVDETDDSPGSEIGSLNGGENSPTYSGPQINSQIPSSDSSSDDGDNAESSSESGNDDPDSSSESGNDDPDRSDSSSDDGDNAGGSSGVVGGDNASGSNSNNKKRKFEEDDDNASGPKKGRGD